MGFILAKFNIKWGSTSAKTSNARLAPLPQLAACLPLTASVSSTSDSVLGKMILVLVLRPQLKGISQLFLPSAGTKR
jgi:hypothetical protein